MTDRKARDGYAELLRHFAAGRVLNWDYDDTSDAFTASDDPAVFRVWLAVWPAYSDVSKHHMTGKHRLNRAGRRTVARYVLFLHSDLEYEWPVPGRWRPWLNLLTLGVWGLLNPLAAGDGDEAVWPFYRRSDLEAEVAKPRLLAGPCS
mgnify:CR=1 FL=1